MKRGGCSSGGDAEASERVRKCRNGYAHPELVNCISLPLETSVAPTRHQSRRGRGRHWSISASRRCRRKSAEFRWAEVRPDEALESSVRTGEGEQVRCQVANVSDRMPTAKASVARKENWGRIARVPRAVLGDFPSFPTCQRWRA